MAKAHLRRTTKDTAELDPQSIREKKTTRLVFKARLVNNKRNALRPVLGDLVWQKRGMAEKDEPWQDETHHPLTGMTAGSGVQLHLSSEELYHLTEVVRGLYGWFYNNEKRLPSGEVEIDLTRSAKIAKDVDIGANLDALLSKVPDEDVGKLFRRLAAGPGSANVVRSLASLPPADLADVGTLAGVGMLRRLLDVWRGNESNDNEGFWQRTLQNHAFILSQLFAAPVVMVGGQASVGGKSVLNSGGKVTDFLMKNALGGHVVLVEIKTPATGLMRSKEYRGGVFAPTEDLAGSVVQVLAQREKLLQSFAVLRNETEDSTGERLRVASPQCVVIVGHRRRLGTAAESDSFEWYRRGLRDVRVVTFDELFQRLQDLLDLLRSGDGAGKASASQVDGPDDRRSAVAAGGSGLTDPGPEHREDFNAHPADEGHHRRRARRSGPPPGRPGPCRRPAARVPCWC